jgi:glycosyltransferase involved in cell wall biosynthesis
MPANVSQRSPIRVLQVARDAGYGGIGGAEILVLEFARQLDPSRFQRLLCTTRAPLGDRRALTRQEASELRRAGVTVLTLDRRTSVSLLPWLRLLALLVRNRVDIVHAHMPRASIPAAILARLARVPVVIAHEHGSTRYGERLRRILNRLIVGRLCDLVLAVSEWDRAQLVAAQGLPASRVAVLPNGIPPLPAPRRNLRSTLAPPGPLVGAIGRLDPVKGYDDLLAAIGLLRRDGVPVHLAIAGVGPDESRLRGLISAWRLDGDVSLLGLRDDVPDLLRALDVAVMSSHSEGAPLAIIEYMAAGLPIVATRVGGIPELIAHDREGLLVAPRDPAALAAALRRLLEDRQLARRLGDAALQRQRSEYAFDVMIERLSDLYERLIATAGGARSDRI